MSDAPVPIVCCIGTTDPWNAAGVGLDTRVLAALGVRAVTVVAGVSAQDAHGVALLRPLDAEAIAAQLRALADAPICAYRIGALLDPASVATVAAHLARTRLPAVYDPVLAATRGGIFADAATRRAIVELLLPRVALATPNAGEVRELAEMRDADPVAAARALVARGATRILVTGIAEDQSVVDVLVDARDARRFAAPRIAFELRGTGCILASGIAAALAAGVALPDAIERARAFVRARILDGESIGTMRLMKLMP